MRIRRLRLELPARMRRTAQADARAIGEAVAAALGRDPGKEPVPGQLRIELSGQGHPGAVLAQEAAGQVAVRSRTWRKGGN